MHFKIIVPAYKCADNLENLCESILSQSYKDWELIISSDACQESYEAAQKIRYRLKPLDAARVKVAINEDRQFALGNIYNCVKYSNNPLDRIIYGVIDGDDQLCNKDALSLIVDEYQKGSSLVWTTYKRDDEGDCVSDNFPETVNPYEYKWVASHFRTFGNWVFQMINPDNFKSPDGDFLPRAYDQALMLPMLYYCNNNNLKTSFIPKVCYQYNHKNSATPKSEHTNGMFEHQLSAFIRARGYIE